MWDKVTLKWDCFHGLPTSVLMDGSFNPKFYDPRVFDTEKRENLHGLFGMEAFSLPSADESSRRGEMHLDIRNMERNIPPKKGALRNLLMQEFKQREGTSFRYAPGIQEPLGTSWSDTIFTVYFFLANGEHFTDLAIEVARAVLAGLGVHDESGIYLTRFDLTRETFAKFEGNWITFENWLRMKHRLPVWDKTEAA
jgi:hypothetical protein